MIALIITVIVLLILAGTAISIAINGGDIFGKASQAREGWNSAVATEEQKVNEVWQILNTMTSGNNGGGGGTNPTATPTATPEPPAALPEGWSITAVASAYTDGTEDTRQVPIPKGFKASIYNDSTANETTIAGGLVIYKTTADLSSVSHETAMTSYDQYVWIPVAKNGAGGIDWGRQSSDTTGLDDGESGTQVIETSEPTTLTTDFTAMDKSVKTYGGFYISRYELGGTVSSPTSVKGQAVLTSDSSSANTWYGLYDAAHQDITDRTNTVLKGHMIFGSEYEKVLAFIDSNNAGYSSTGHENKQQTEKHASGVIAEGQTDKKLDIINNIIDLEGNVFEWTAQAGSTSSRYWRGGNYESSANNLFREAYYRHDLGPTYAYDGAGTRQALYVML